MLGGPGWEHPECIVCICPPPHPLPAPASPGRQSSAPMPLPGLAASGGAAVAAPEGPAGKGGHRRWGPADVCQRAELLCQGALAGGSVDSQCSALHLPAPPVAFGAYVSAPRLGSPRQHRRSPGDPGTGSRGRCTPRCSSITPGITRRPAPLLGGRNSSRVPAKRLRGCSLVLSQPHVLSLGETAALVRRLRFAPGHPCLPTRWISPRLRGEQSCLEIIGAQNKGCMQMGVCSSGGGSVGQGFHK